MLLISIYGERKLAAFHNENGQKHYFEPLLHSWSCYSICREYVKRHHYSLTDSFSNSSCASITYLLKVEVYSNYIDFLLV